MSTTGKEYKLAIRIAGIVDRSFTTSLTSTNTSLKASVATWNSSFTQLDKGFNSIMSVGQTAFSTIAKAAGVATAAITALAAAGLDPISAGSDFESAFAGVKKTVDATEEEYAQLRQDILDMSEVLPSTASEIAEVMEIAGQLGIDTDSLTDFTEVMINLGESTNLEAADAADQLARFANVVNMSNYGDDGVSNYERLGSVIVDLGNNFATTEEEIVEMATNLSATGDMVGMTEAQIMALATAMSATGIKANKGGTAMSKLIRYMQLAVETESEALSDYARVANMTEKEFSETFTNDAVVAVGAFIEGLSDTERLGSSAIKTLNDMGITETRLTDVVLRLANAQGDLTDEELEAAVADEIFEDTAVDTAYSASLLSEAIATANEAWEENTALAVEAGKRYETTESQVDVLKNLFTEMGITIYDEIRPMYVDAIAEINTALKSMNDYLGSADGVSKWVKNIKTSAPAAVKNIKQIVESFTPVLNIASSIWNVLSDIGGWFVSNPAVIVGAIYSIGSALTAYKIGSNATHLLNSLLNFGSSLNPTTVAIMAVVSAIGLLTGVIKAYESYRDRLADDNLVNHFGSIALSMSEIQEVAEYLVGTESLEAVQAALAEFDELDGFASTMEAAISEINKMNWKVSIGMELSEDDQDSYIEYIDQYVTAAQEYALQEQYAVSLNLAAMFDTTDPDQADIVDKVNSFYASCYDDMASLGESLSDAVNEAFADGILDADEISEIADIQAKMAELQENLAEGELEAQFALAGANYSGTSLDYETFLSLAGDIDSAVQEANDAYAESYASTVKSLYLTYGGEGEEYDAALAVATQEYLDNKAETSAKGLNYLPESLEDTYGDEISAAIASVVEQYSSDSYSQAWAEKPQQMLEEVAWALTEALPQDTRDALGIVLDEISGSIDTVHELVGEYEAAGADIPEYLTETLQLADILSAASGDAESAWSVMQDTIVNEEDFEAVKETLEAQGWELYTYTAQVLEEAFSEGFDISADVNFSFNTSTSLGLSRSTLSTAASSAFSDIGGRASGGLATSPELTWFAEDGPEMAIPIDGSSNAISLWEQTGRMLGMDSAFDGLDLDAGGSEMVIEYSPTLQFYGDTPSKQDLEDAMEISQDKFNSMMDKYMKSRSRVSFG
ncbi:MAG: phage tail tape measure protein [Lachnospiraceae bacterium]|nr:phage tail tape measure protein [Lachnospiraceae bacterium]